MRGLGRAALLVTAGLLLGVSVYTGLVEVGLVRSPFAPVAAGDLKLARSSRDGVRVLFVGNSLTFKNDLPELVHRLGGRRTPIYAGSFTAPGWELRQFAGDYQFDRLLKEVRWDVVVLQEQSQTPSFEAAGRGREFIPYVKELADRFERAAPSRSSSSHGRIASATAATSRATRTRRCSSASSTGTRMRRGHRRLPLHRSVSPGRKRSRAARS